MPRVRFGVPALLGLLIALAIAGCGGTSAPNSSSQSSSAQSPSGRSNGAIVHTKAVTISGTSTTVLASAQGKTLYYFKPDTATQIACTSSCAQLWPPLVASSSAVSSASALAGTLRVVTGPNGRQVVYNGHPLYTYSKDQDSGDAYGQGVAGEWFVATPNLAP